MNLVQNNSRTEIPRRSTTVPCTAYAPEVYKGYLSGKREGARFLGRRPLSPWDTIRGSTLCERSLFVLLALFWQGFRSTTPQTATKDVGHLSRKSNSRENNQSQDDSVTTDGRRLPASISRPVGKRFLVSQLRWTAV